MALACSLHTIRSVSQCLVDQTVVKTVDDSNIHRSDSTVNGCGQVKTFYSVLLQEIIGPVQDFVRLNSVRHCKICYLKDSQL